MASLKKKRVVDAYEFLAGRGRIYKENYPRAYEGTDDAGVITFTETFKIGDLRVKEEHCISIDEIEEEL